MKKLQRKTTRVQIAIYFDLNKPEQFQSTALRMFVLSLLVTFKLERLKKIRTFLHSIENKRLLPVPNTNLHIVNYTRFLSDVGFV